MHNSTAVGVAVTGDSLTEYSHKAGPIFKRWNTTISLIFFSQPYWDGAYTEHCASFKMYNVTIWLYIVQNTGTMRLVFTSATSHKYPSFLLATMFKICSLSHFYTPYRDGAGHDVPRLYPSRRGRSMPPPLGLGRCICVFANGRISFFWWLDNTLLCLDPTLAFPLTHRWPFRLLPCFRYCELMLLWMWGPGSSSR